MIKAIVVLLLVAVAIISGGFYLGWFSLKNEQHALNNKVDVNLTIDPDKAKADISKVTSFK